MKRFDITLRNVFDLKGDVVKSYGLVAYPTTYVVSPQGKVSHAVLGALNEERMEAMEAQVRGLLPKDAP